MEAYPGGERDPEGVRHAFHQWHGGDLGLDLHPTRWPTGSWPRPWRVRCSSAGTASRAGRPSIRPEPAPPDRGQIEIEPFRKSVAPMRALIRTGLPSDASFLARSRVFPMASGLSSLRPTPP